MQFTIGEYSSTEISLSSHAQLLIFIQDLPIEGVDILEFLVGGISMPVDLVLDLARCRGYRYHPLDVEEFVTNQISSLSTL